MKFPGRRQTPPICLSPPARGAWIEMLMERMAELGPDSRPPHGGRGLKYAQNGKHSYANGSPPARGAWIEITSGRRSFTVCISRPPHGGRGLKSFMLYSNASA